jgi:hypothetical protein
MLDLLGLIPHSKKEAKLDRKIAKDTVDELCMERSCNNWKGSVYVDVQIT